MKVGILGCGAYGLALSDVVNKNNHEITMWTKFEEEKRLLETTRKNKVALKNYILPEKIKITDSLEESMKEKDLLIIVIPSQFVLELAKEMAKYYKDQHILIASKGIDDTTQLLLHEIVKQCIKTDKVAVLSGPSFAKDLIKQEPVGLTLASENKETQNIVSAIMSTEYIELSLTTDIKGVELCGAIKNTIAISIGILDGLKINQSTKYMYLTKIMISLQKILSEMDLNPQSLISYSGIGDILLTCHSENSRNYSYGKMLGQKESYEEIDKYKSSNTIEGIATSLTFNKILNNKNIKNRTFETINDIILGIKKPESIIENLIANDTHKIN